MTHEPNVEHFLTKGKEYVRVWCDKGFSVVHLKEALEIVVALHERNCLNETK